MLTDASNYFFMRQDGSFRAYLGGDILIKAAKVGDVEGYHFEGVASTPEKDLEDEQLLQKGLNFQPFMDSGEFNWHHIPHALMGHPVGKKAWFEGNKWHTEGLILKGMPIVPGYDSDMVIKQHVMLKKAGSPRGLCQSVEGSVTKRSKCGKFVEKADIFNVALTFKPINANTPISLLAKSMDKKLQIAVVEDSFYKALSAPDSFVKEDLEAAANNSLEARLKKRLISKGHSESDAEKHVAAFLRKTFLGKTA